MTQDSLPVQKLPRRHGNRPVGRVHQVVHILAVLIGQRVLAAPETANQKTFHSAQARTKGRWDTNATPGQNTPSRYFGSLSQSLPGLFHCGTYCRMRVTRRIASTATSYSLSRVMDTMRSLKRLVNSSSLGNSSLLVYRFCNAFRHLRRTSPCWGGERRWTVSQYWFLEKTLSRECVRPHAYSIM